MCNDQEMEEMVFTLLLMFPLTGNVMVVPVPIHEQHAQEMFVSGGPCKPHVYVQPSKCKVFGARR